MDTMQKPGSLSIRLTLPNSHFPQASSESINFLQVVKVNGNIADGDVRNSSSLERIRDVGS